MWGSGHKFQSLCFNSDSGTLPPLDQRKPLAVRKRIRRHVVEAVGNPDLGELVHGPPRYALPAKNRLSIVVAHGGRLARALWGASGKADSAIPLELQTDLQFDSECANTLAYLRRFWGA